MVTLKTRPAHFLITLALMVLFVACDQQPQTGTNPTPQVVVVTATPDTSIAQVEPTAVVVTVVVTPTEDAAVVEEPTATAVPPTETPLPEPTATLEPTPTPQPTATPEAPALPAPDWLNYLNEFRAMANLPDLVENIDLSYSDLQHSRYMVNTDRLQHFEKNDVEWYSVEGDLAAKKGNIAASQLSSTPEDWPIEFWISAPFHLIPIIDPELREVGFGVYRNEVGTYHMTATLDVLRGFASEPVTLERPVLFPADGAETWVIRHSLFEWPNPKHSCPGYPEYPEPVGPAIVAQIGLGNRTPSVSYHSFSVDGFELPHCVYDETNYTSPDANQQRIGRLVLGERDAIVLMPRHPLEIDKTYTVRLVVNGEEITWSFKAVNKPD